MDLILEAGIFSNSDKYSLFFTIHQLPQAQQEMMLSQLNEQQMNELMENSNSNPEMIKRLNESPGAISNQYLHDLYRFFKLSVRRQEFRDIFQDKLDFHNVPALDNILYWADVLFPIADFYISKERWEEAVEIYKELEEIGEFEGDDIADGYQKFGYVLQKTKQYEEAIQAYLKADTLKPDNIWNNRHLATCYRLTKNYRAALTYYKKVEEVAPEDANVIFYIGNCLAEMEQYEEALNYFFKLDFIKSNCMKAWRGIGWCSFISRKYKQAMKYYEKIIGQKPQAIDYMNAGHVAWVMGDIQKAVTFYEKAIIACESREHFLEMFHKDEEALLKQGVREEDIPLMLDLL